ncbi:MAG TPA: hypothetical protein VK356_13515 [Thermomicrobiales bacterium]|nr:hypothetical protein [Thermomicrobiales bacterium]
MGEVARLKAVDVQTRGVPSALLPALRLTLGAKRFPALLAFLLPISPELRLPRLWSGVTAGSSRLRLNPEDAFSSMNRNGDPFFLCSLDNLVFPAKVIALLCARNLRRLAFAQGIDQRFPIDLTILVQNS